MDGRNRGRMAASLDSQGASLGCVGLIGFAFVLWKWVDHHNALVMISTAAIFWLMIAYGSGHSEQNDYMRIDDSHVGWFRSIETAEMCGHGAQALWAFESII